MLIARSYITSRLLPDSPKMPVYTQVTAKRRTDDMKNQTIDQAEYITVYKEIPKQTAMKLIEENNLHLVVENKHGMIWDSIEDSFMEKYGGNIIIN